MNASLVRVLMVAAAFLGGTAGAARADLIVNGSFENPNVGSGFGTYANGSVPGWTSNNNEIEIDSTSGALGLSNYAGTQSAELNGSTFDTISQTVTGLVVGQTYALSWAYSGRGGSGAQQMNVLVNGVVVGSNSDNGTSTPHWISNLVVVTATAASEVLSFAALNVGGSASIGNELDAVTLNTFVPEPASLAILAVGTIGLLGWRKRLARSRAPTA